MQRSWLVGVALLAVGWAGVVGALVLGDPTGRVARAALGLTALLTAAAHLVARLAAGAWSEGRVADDGPDWVAVQAERHRRLATWFAAWGVGGATLAGLAAWSASGRTVPTWAPRLIAGVNLGFQPGLLLAEGWAIMALGRVVRSARPLAGLGPN